MPPADPVPRYIEHAEDGQGTTAHVYMEKGGGCDLTVTLYSEASSGRQQPVYYSGGVVAGSIELALAKKQVIQYVIVKASKAALGARGSESF